MKIVGYKPEGFEEKSAYQELSWDSKLAVEHEWLFDLIQEHWHIAFELFVVMCFLFVGWAIGFDEQIKGMSSGFGRALTYVGLLWFFAALMNMLVTIPQKITSLALALPILIFGIYLNDNGLSSAMFISGITMIVCSAISAMFLTPACKILVPLGIVFILLGKFIVTSDIPTYPPYREKIIQWNAMSFEAKRDFLNKASGTPNDAKRKFVEDFYRYENGEIKQYGKDF